VTNRELAEKIALALCTNYDGQVARRLVLMVGEPERNVGGRCYRNVVTTVETVLDKWNRCPSFLLQALNEGDGVYQP